jgi:hypothetical protein
MKLKYKEDPREWRKSALLTLLGVGLLSSLLRWRHFFSATVWLSLLGGAGGCALLAILKPTWFRGYYRLSLRLGFYSSQFLGRCVLALFFFLILTPLGIILRLAGKDPLQLRPHKKVASYWQDAKASTDLDRLF